MSYWEAEYTHVVLVPEQSFVWNSSPPLASSTFLPSYHCIYSLSIFMENDPLPSKCTWSLFWNETRFSHCTNPSLHMFLLEPLFNICNHSCTWWNEISSGGSVKQQQLLGINHTITFCDHIYLLWRLPWLLIFIPCSAQILLLFFLTVSNLSTPHL